MSPKRSRSIWIVLLLILLALLVLLFARCRSTEKLPPVAVDRTPAKSPASVPTPAVPSTPALATEPTEDVLTPATLTAPASVIAGAAFKVQWTGPGNRDDYVTMVKPDAPEGNYTDYKLTRTGSTLELTAPVEPGAMELRYVAGRAKKVLGRAAIEVLATSATLSAPGQAALGSTISVTWTGPDNVSDYITVVPRDAADNQYGNYTLTREGSPLNLTLPVDPGEAEIRYVTGTDHKVLGRRAITVTAPDTSLDAPASVVAGATIDVTWSGPNNPADYVTIVPRGALDGQYRNYAPTKSGSPLKLLTLIESGEAELRYMTGTKGRVLARRPITLLPIPITLEAPAEAKADSKVDVTWTGPAYGGDYVTIVPAGMTDGNYAGYQSTKSGSPLKISAPKQSGPAEIRYMSGQGGKVLARRSILITP